MVLLRTNLFFCWIFLIFIGISSLSYLPEPQYLALYDLYQSTNGTYWTWLPTATYGGYPWNFTDPEANPCDPSHPWQGVQCSGTCKNSSCYITALALTGHGLNGTIPSSLSVLTNLTLLSLAQNTLLGTIPKELSSLTKLYLFDVSVNTLEGIIPEEFCQLINLEFFILYDNHLSGPLPQSLGQLIKLQQLFAFENELTSTLPDSLFTISTLTQILLYSNQLTGSLPQNMQQLTKITQINLYSNQLTGTIPQSMVELTTLNEIYLYSNFLTGTIPSDLTQLVNLYYLLIHNNLFTGIIPNTICSLSKLNNLMINSNQITGSIPENFGNLTSLTNFNAYYNPITGTIPASFGQLNKLYYLYLYNTYITGTLPPELSLARSLSYVMISSNYISGTLPSNYSVFPDMLNLLLDTNLLTGTLPSSWSNLTTIITLTLFANQLTGTLPISWSLMKDITYLYIFDNLFTGTIPSEYSQLSYLSSLDLESNLLTGTIPETFANSTLLLYFYLSSNRFTGTLPTYLFTKRFLWEVVLFNNYFTGSIPEVSLNSTYLSGLDILDLSYNLLTGILPLSITYYEFVDYMNLEHNYLTGSLPEDMLTHNSLVYYSISNNYFMGNLPMKLSEINRLKYLDFSTNYFTGNLPNDVYGTILSSLSYLSVANNYLTSSLPSQIGGKYLQVLYLQNNSFTGSIASTLIANQNITIFMASLNCFIGTIPDTFCQNPNLFQLIMDGLHSSQGCIHNLFSFDGKSSYSIVNGVHGTIPSCLFNMSSLKVLHLSGNNLHGNLPKEMNGSHLTSLIVSNNLLTGSIPSSLWTKELVYLDLSFNQFSSGDFSLVNTYSKSIQTIHNDSELYNITSKPSIRLQVNHFSGKLPPSLSSNVSNELDINILDGNMFSCDLYRDDIPSQDPNYDSYQCGSQNTNTSLYITLSFLMLICILLCLQYPIKHFINKSQELFQLFQKNEQIIVQIQRSSQYSITFPHISRVFLCLQLLIHWLCLSILWIVIIILPIYSLLSQLFYTYQHQYVWIISSSYLSGLIPSVVLLCLFLVLVGLSTDFFLFYSQQQLHSFSFFSFSSLFSCFTSTNSHQNNPSTRLLPTLPSEETVIYLSKLFVILFLETGVVLVVNFSYVLALNHGYDEITITSITVAISIFKLLWGNIVLLGYGRLLLEEYFQLKLHTGMIIAMSLFNNVVAPYLAEALVSSNCFYYAITSSPIVNTLFYALQCYPTFKCSSYYIESIASYSEQCTFEVQCESYSGSLLEEYSHFLTTISYHPPFHYNYTCSSSLLAAFAYVFIYRYLFTGILEPMFFLFIKYIQNHVNSLTLIQIFSMISWGKIKTNEDIFLLTTSLLPFIYKFESFPHGNHNNNNNKFEDPEMPSKQVNNGEEGSINPVLKEIDRNPSFSSIDILPSPQTQGIAFMIHSLTIMKTTLMRIIPPGEKSIVRLITDITVMLSFGVLFPPLGILIFLSLLKDIFIEQFLLQRLFLSYQMLQTNELSLEPNIIQLFQDILLQIDSSYDIWMSQFWLGWWWSTFVAVWFWSFSLYDTLARDIGPVRSIWIILIMGLSPYWMKSLLALLIQGINICLSCQMFKKKNIDLNENSNIVHQTNHLEENSQDMNHIDLEERLTELTLRKESDCLSSPKPSIISRPSDTLHKDEQDL